MYDKKVLVVGASVIDITGVVNKKLILADSNPGKIKFSMGGVGRNIAENLVRLDIPVEFISAFGNDVYGKDLWTKCKEAGISMGNCVIGNEQTSAIYISINNPEGDLAMAVSDTGITDLITSDFLESKVHIFQNSDIIVLDTNLTPETLEYICNKYSDKKLFIDFVSTTKAMKVKNFIGKFHTIKPNLIEAEALSGIPYKSDDDLPKIANYFLNQGTKHIFISLGSHGSYYADENFKGVFESAKIELVNVSGAGDAFIAGTVYSLLNQKNIHDTVLFSTAMAIANIMSESAVNENISVAFIEQIIQKYNLC